MQILKLASEAIYLMFLFIILYNYTSALCKNASLFY